jgi:hypothetical protein
LAVEVEVGPDFEVRLDLVDLGVPDVSLSGSCLYFDRLRAFL